MFFTEEDYRNIENWLLARIIKDSELPDADSLKKSDRVSLIQDGNNKTVNLERFIKEVSSMGLSDFFNVTTFSKQTCLSLEKAVCLVPVKQRKLGLTITFHSEKNNWVIYQFRGTSLNQWSSVHCWRSLLEEALEEFIYLPDEEDITAVVRGNRSYLQLKDKEYKPSQFSGMGVRILRKNLVGEEACSEEDESTLKNVLTPDMFQKQNTIFVIRYDFDLEGRTIPMLPGCTLLFQGGSLNNGRLILRQTGIMGIINQSDIGKDIQLMGSYKDGQILAVRDTTTGVSELKWYAYNKWLTIGKA